VSMGISGGVPKILRESKDIEAGASISELEEHYRQPIRAVMAWLGRPKPLKQDDMEAYFSQDTQAARFLLDSAQSTKIGLVITAGITPDAVVSIELNRAVTKLLRPRRSRSFCPARYFRILPAFSSFVLLEALAFALQPSEQKRDRPVR